MQITQLELKRFLKSSLIEIPLRVFEKPFVASLAVCCNASVKKIKIPSYDVIDGKSHNICCTTCHADNLRSPNVFHNRKKNVLQIVEQLQLFMNPEQIPSSCDQTAGQNAP